MFIFHLSRSLTAAPHIRHIVYLCSTYEYQFDFNYKLNLTIIVIKIQIVIIMICVYGDVRYECWMVLQMLLPLQRNEYTHTHTNMHIMRGRNTKRERKTPDRTYDYPAWFYYYVRRVYDYILACTIVCACECLWVSSTYAFDICALLLTSYTVQYQW